MARRSMKLTLVVHQFLPRYFTGTEQYVYAIAKAMQARGHDVEVFALEPEFSFRSPEFELAHEVVDGIPVARLRFWYCTDRDFERMEHRNPLVAATFANYLARRQPELVHFFHLRYLGAALISEARALGLASVVHLMDFWFLCPAIVLRRGDGRLCEGPPEQGRGCIQCQNSGLNDVLVRQRLDPDLQETGALVPAGGVSGSSAAHRALSWMGRPALLRHHLLQANKIVAPSRFLRSMFVRNGYPEERISVLGYGVAESRLAACQGERAPRQQGGPLRVAFVGSIAEFKGVDLVVDAVLGSKANLQLTVHGRLEDFESYSRPLVERSRHDDRVCFPGPLVGDQIGAALGQADVLVVPSRWYENTPFVVLEAFAAGVPVLAADLGGLSEAVIDGHDGELFAAGDVQDLRARLERLAAQPDLLDRYRAAISRPKGMRDNAAEIEAIYEEALGEDRAGVGR